MQLLCILFCLIITFALPLFSKETNYDELTARKLLNMAAAAYGEDEQKEECLNRTFPSYESHVVANGMEGSCDDLNNMCGCYVAASETAKQLIIVFRGTKTTTQLLMEGLESTQPGENFLGMGDVNRYFLRGHQAIWKMLEGNILQNPLYTGYKLIFTGHSLGGALAVLAAAQTVKEGYRPGNEITIYTFGEPRVGDVKFAESFDQMIPDSYRVVFRRDIVAHLPPCFKNESFGDDKASRPCDRDKLHGPYHHSTEIWYPDSMEPGSHYIECVGEPKGEDFSCSDKYKFRYDQYNRYVWDHRHYFTVAVYQYGESGCNITVPEGEPGAAEKIVNQ